MRKTRAIFSIIFVWVLFFVGCTNDLVAPENPSLSGKGTEGGEYQSVTSSAPVAISEELVAAFDKELAAAELTSKTVELSQFNELQAAVWQAWKAANASDLEKFPKLQPFPETHLDTDSAPKWIVPGALGGKDYEMPYEYGWLGSEPRTDAAIDYKSCLFIYLHGSGDNRDAEWETGYDACTSSMETILTNKKYDKGIFFNPRGPDGSDYNKWWKAPYQKVWEDFFRRALLQDYVNPFGIFLFGFSEGAYASQRMASFYADYFTGVAPLSGGEPLENAPPENLLHVFYVMNTGELDTDYGRRELTEELGKKLEELQTPYIEFEGQYPQEYLHTVNILSNFKHSEVVPSSGPSGLTGFTRYRTINPSEVRWEDFPMDGQRRVGFYNIHVLERAATTPDARTYYHLKIESGNKISLSAQDVSYTVDTYCSSASTIPLEYTKTYTPVTGGRLRIYLHPNMNKLDLTQPVTITINEGSAQQIMPVVSVQAMIDSVKAFFDPQRIYPAYIEVDVTPAT